MIGVDPTSGFLVVGVMWVMGLVVVAVESRFPQARRTTFVLSLSSLALAAALAGLLWPGDNEQLLAGGGLKLDGFALFVQAFVLLAAVCCLLFARHEGKAWRPGSDGLLLLSAAGVTLLAMAVDLVGVLVGFVASLIPLLGLAALSPDSKGREAALKGTVLAVLGTVLLGMGTVLLASHSGSTTLADLHSYFQTSSWIGDQPLQVVGLALVMSGLGLFLAVVPFHMLFTDLIDGLPSPAALLLSAGVMVSGLAACTRIMLVAFGPLGDSGPGYLSWIEVIHVCGLVALLVGNAMAMVQRRLKRLLACLTVGQVGMVLVTLSAAGQIGLTGQPGMAEAVGGILVFLAVYAINWVGLFVAISALSSPEETGGSALAVGHLEGLARRNPWLAAGIGLSLLCMAGMPLTAGFFARLHLLEVMVTVGWVGTALAVALSLGLVLVMSLGLLTAMLIRPASEYVRVSTSPSLVVTAWLAAVAILALGLLPGGVLELAVRSASSMLGQ